MLKNFPNLNKSIPLFLLIPVLLGLLLIGLFLIGLRETDSNDTTSLKSTVRNIIETPPPTPIPLKTPESSKILTGGTQVFQRYNNCGPAALSMALSYFGINETQEKLGQDLRPYQIPGGDNDDKSVTLEELAEKSREYGFTPFHRPNGSPELIRHFITYDMPVIARTWTKPNEDIGHYRIIKGYDDATREIIQDDSLQGKDTHYSYEDFNVIWKKFNYEYLVLVPADKVSVVEQILREDADEKTAWTKAVLNSENELQSDPSDIYARFNLSVALYNVGEYERSVAEFEKVEHLLPFRTLWYQIEPIQAYYELGDYERVFEITNRVLNNYNRAFSELYIIRGNIYKNQENSQLARQEYEKAILYNSNLKSARSALTSLN